MYVSRTDRYTFGCIMYWRPWRDSRCLRPVRLSAGSQGRATAKPPRAGGFGGLDLSLRPDVDTAVYVDGLAGDVVTVFYKVTGGPGDFLGLAEASQGHLFAKLLLGLLGDVGDHIGLDKAGAEGVHGDPEPGQFQGGRLGKAEQPGLGRRVVGLAYVAGLPDERAHVDDLAPALVRHVRQHGVDRI